GAALASPLALPRALAAGPGDTLSGQAFGTSWQIVGPPRTGLESLGPDINALFAEVDAQMSPYRADSTISRFNAAPSGLYAADAETRLVAARALALAQQSDGAFDPTVGPLVAQWGFGPITGSNHPDWRGLTLDAGAIGKARDALTLDLCGIAKGRALDRAVDLMRDAGLNNLLFDLGGEFKALGHHPSGRDWQVAVQHPLAGLTPPAALRMAAGTAVATSGLRTQSYVLADKTYGHIINPDTATPADAGLLSVSVVAEDAMTADGWATALFAAGPDTGVTLARDLRLAALFLVRDGATIRQIKTGAIDTMLL
ncbi:MAG: FAD:protein FMN transferase, partial [Octadecabacter sp.]|nr:FAD:protein FMN transferase [Octadecabacter sp.]